MSFSISQVNVGLHLSLSCAGACIFYISMCVVVVGRMRTERSYSKSTPRPRECFILFYFLLCSLPLLARLSGYRLPVRIPDFVICLPDFVALFTTTSNSFFSLTGIASVSSQIGLQCTVFHTCSTIGRSLTLSVHSQALLGALVLSFSWSFCLLASHTVSLAVSIHSTRLL